MTEQTTFEPDARRALQLALATLWLLDGVLQLQSLMFTSGAQGFNGMLRATAVGNPPVVAHSIGWASTFVASHAQSTNAMFALVQLLLGIGIAWHPTVKVALAASVGWSLAVWWFGEGLGGILHGQASPLAGGPGAVLFYALLAVVLWPREPDASRHSCVAAMGLGERAARVVWVLVWATLGMLATLGAARSPDYDATLVRSLEPGEPGWLAGLDRHVSSALSGHGAAVAATLCVVLVCIAVAGVLTRGARRAAVLGAMVVALVIWVLTENFGRALEPGATDLNSGPLLVLVALAYWPTVAPRHRRTRRVSLAGGVPTRMAEVV